MVWKGESKRHELSAKRVKTKDADVLAHAKFIRYKFEYGQHIHKHGIRYSDKEVDGWNEMGKTGTAWDYRYPDGGGIKVIREPHSEFYSVIVAYPFDNAIMTVHAGSYKDVDEAIQHGIEEYVENVYGNGGK